MSHQPKAISRDEARHIFLKHIADLVTYWEKESRTPDIRGKLEGLAFSILTTLDGNSGGIPGYLLIPNTTQEDNDYLKNQGVDWNPVPPDEAHSFDIGGGLHEHIHPYFRGEVTQPDHLYDFNEYLADQAKQFHGGA